MEYQWFEEQPSSCPPFDSVECNGPYFRVSYGNPAEAEDFFSQKRGAPNKVCKGEGIDDCIVRAVSVFSLLVDAKRLLKLPKYKHANIAEVSLRTMDGKIKKTFKNSHYSWWRSKAFDIKRQKQQNYEYETIQAKGRQHTGVLRQSSIANRKGLF